MKISQLKNKGDKTKDLSDISKYKSKANFEIKINSKVKLIVLTI